MLRERVAEMEIEHKAQLQEMKQSHNQRYVVLFVRHSTDRVR